MSQASAVPVGKRNRQANYSQSELSLLADEVRDKSNVLFSSFSSVMTYQMKLKAWDDIATKMSACSSVSRTGAQIRKKWNDYKSQVKRKAMDVRKEAAKTGGGDAPELLSDVEHKVISLIPPCQIEGIQGGFDTEDFNDKPECQKNKAVPKIPKKRAPVASHKTYQTPAHVSSVLDIEAANMDSLTKLVEIQLKMLKLTEDQVAINRERLELEKAKWEVKKVQYELVHIYPSEISQAVPEVSEMSVTPFIKF